MSFTYGFYNSKNKDRVYDAKQISSLFYGPVCDGIFGSIGNSFICEEIDLNHIKVKSGFGYFKGIFVKNDSDVILEIPDSKYPNVQVGSISVSQNPNQIHYPVGNKIQLDGIQIQGSSEQTSLIEITATTGDQSHYPEGNPMNLDGVVVKGLVDHIEVSIKGNVYIVLERDELNRRFNLSVISTSEYDETIHIILAIITRTGNNIKVTNMVGRNSNYIIINEEFNTLDDWGSSLNFGDVYEIQLTSTLLTNPLDINPYFNTYYTSGTIRYINEEGTSGQQYQMIRNVTPLFSESLKNGDYFINSEEIIFRITSMTRTNNSISLTAKRVSEYHIPVSGSYLTYVNTKIKNVHGTKLITGLNDSSFIDTIITLINNKYYKFDAEWRTLKTLEYEDWLDFNEYYLYHQSGSTQYSRFQSEVNSKNNKHRVTDWYSATFGSESIDIPIDSLSSTSCVSVRTIPYGLYINDIILGDNKITLKFDKLKGNYKFMAIIK